MTYDVSRRSLLALGAGLGASTLLGGSALARAPKLGTQTPYWHRFILGDAEVTVVSDGQLPLGPPKGTFIGVPDEQVKQMLVDNFLSPDNVVLELTADEAPHWLNLFRPVRSLRSNEVIGDADATQIFVGNVSFKVPTSALPATASPVTRPA